MCLKAALYSVLCCVFLLVTLGLVFAGRCASALYDAEGSFDERIGSDEFEDWDNPNYWISGVFLSVFFWGVIAITILVLGVAERIYIKCSDRVADQLLGCCCGSSERRSMPIADGSQKQDHHHYYSPPKVYTDQVNGVDCLTLAGGQRRVESVV